MTNRITQDRRTRAAGGVNVVAQYLFTLTFVIAGYFTYLKLAVPFIEGPAKKQVVKNIIPTATLVAPPIDKRRLIPLLPKNAWELGDCKTIITPTGTFLFRKFEQLDDGTLKVSPITLISGLGEEELVQRSSTNQVSSTPNQGKTPTVLRCLQGAVLKFDRPVKEALEKGAKLEMARLAEEVDIYRPASQADDSDVLHILTRNVQVDRQRIYALEQVAFSYGPHRGRGRNLMIDLAHDQSTLASERDFTTVEGVSRLELAFLDHLRIEPSKTSNSLQPETASKKRSIFDSDSPLHVSCRGPFVFDFATNTVTLQKEVVAQQIDKFQNNIHCDQLTLVFKSKTDGRPKRSSLPAESTSVAESGTSKLELRSFAAVGRPAKVVSNSQPAKITAEEINYDARSNQIFARSGQGNVTYVSPQHQVVARQVRYVLTEDGSLGALQAEGAGRLLSLGKRPDKKDELFLTWQEALTVKRDPRQPDLQLISIFGETKIRLGGDMAIDSERLTLRLRQSKNRKGDWEYEPLELVANSKVNFKTPRIEGTTERLTAQWKPWANQQTQRPYRVGRVSYSQSSSPQEPSRFVERSLPLDNASKNAPIRSASYFQELELPKRNLSQPPTRRDGSSVPLLPGQQPAAGQQPSNDKHLRFRGREVTLQLATDKRQTRLIDLVAEGDVVISQHASQRDPSPVVKMQGDYLRVVPQTDTAITNADDTSDQKFRALISSKIERATIETDDFNLAGTQINLDQDANKVWVKGEGKIRFASPAEKQRKPGQATSPFDLNQGEEQTMVAWEGGMIFDGTSIYFEHQVELSTERTGKKDRTVTTANGEALKVELNQRVDMGQLNLEQNDQDASLRGVDVKELVFVDGLPDASRRFPMPEAAIGPSVSRPLNIQIETFDRATGNQTARQVVSSRQATILPASERITAEGPGTVAVWQRELKRNQPPAEANRQAPPRSANPLARFSKGKRNGLSFVQINFDGKLNLDGQSKQFNVSQRIRTAYMSVPNWDQGVDPDQLQQQSVPGAVVMTSDRLNLAQWQPRNADKPINDLLATGNVRITSDEIDSTSDRVSYNEATDTLVIEGTPRSDAVLWFSKPNSTAKQKLVHQKIRFRIYDQSYETTLKSITINQ